MPEMEFTPDWREAEFCVCVLADAETPFTDNDHGVCHDCGKAVQYRPYVPAATKKLCIECFTIRVNAGSLNN